MMSTRKDAGEGVERPLRLLVIDEGVLGHRTLKRQLEAALAALPGVEVRMETVPPPSRLGRPFTRRWLRRSQADLQRLRWRLRWSWATRRLLKSYAGWADVALINTQAAALLAKAPMRRLPCVLSIDATAGQFGALEYTGPGDRWTARELRLIKRLERRALRAAAAAMPWTEWNATALRAEYELGDARVEIIHPGLDAAWWGRAAASRVQGDHGPLRVLFVGNDVHRKGLDTLMEAIAELGEGAVLDVVSGDQIEPRERVRIHRGITAGSDDLRDIYAKADVLALPTQGDAVPWVVLEAMASGLPVVASEVGAIPEMVGECGELVPPGDVEALRDALSRLRDPGRRRELGERAQRRVADHYDNARQTLRIADLARTVAEPEGGRRFRRRTVVAAGVGVAALAVASPYLALIPGDEFEQLVASHLGIGTDLARQLLAHAREEYGQAEYDARAAAFAFAVRDPVAAVMPESARRKAVDGMLDPMLSAPASNLAYAITGSEPSTPACAGLVRPS